jgi:hypothetical protein
MLTQVNDCDTGNTKLSQRWFVDDLSRLRPTNAPTMCLDVAGGWATIATCSTSNTQTFRMNTTAVVREYLQQFGGRVDQCRCCSVNHCAAGGTHCAD